MKNWLENLLRDGDNGSGSGGDPAPTAAPTGSLITGATPPPVTPEETPKPKGAGPEVTGGKGDEPKLPDGSPAEKPPSANEPPIVPAPLTAADIVLPEGFQASDEAKTQFVELMNDTKLSRAELATKLIEMQAGVAMNATKDAEAAATAAWQETQKQFQTQAQSLPGIDGSADKLNATLGDIKRAMDTAFGANEHGNAMIGEGEAKMPLKQAVFAALDATGAGNHPAMIWALSILTKPFLEKAPISGGPPGQKLTQAERMFPSMAGKQ